MGCCSQRGGFFFAGKRKASVKNCGVGAGIEPEKRGNTTIGGAKRLCSRKIQDSWTKSQALSLAKDFT